MHTVQFGGKAVDIHASVYTPYLHEQLFGCDLFDDLDAIRAGLDAPPLSECLRCAWSMAATAAVVGGWTAPSLSSLSDGFEPTAGIAASILAEARNGLHVETRGDSAGGASDDRGYSASLLMISMSRGISPRGLAETTMRTLIGACPARGDVTAGGTRDATTADIMRLLG